MNIEETLLNHRRMNYSSFHTPGHKGKRIGYIPLPEDDITELVGTDDLHEPEGMIKASMELAASLYDSEVSFFSTNGSTASNMAAIDSLTNIGDKILVCGDYHKSVTNIAVLKKLKLLFVPSKPLLSSHPQISAGADSEKIDQTLKSESNVKAVFLTSPSYEGILSDVGEIAKKVHSHGLPLIVDEAHGAHLALCPSLPKSALHSGADIVINSLHKTLPALTGASVLHVSRTSMADKERVRESLLRFLSTSPSYLTLASIDSCLNLLKSRGIEMFERLLSHLEDFYKELKDLTYLKLLRKEDCFECIKDPTRIVVLCLDHRMNADRLYRILRRDFRIEMEKSNVNYVIGISTVADEKEDLDRLKSALIRIDTGIGEGVYDASHL